MDIEKCDVKFGSPVLFTLALLIIIPSSTGYIDCRISCRRCHKNTEHPAVLEVYCAMCEECKQRRRERMLGRTTKEKTKSPILRMRDGVEASTDSDALMMRPQEALQPREGDQDFQQPFVEQQEPFRQPDSLQPPEPMPPQDPLEPPELLQPTELLQQLQEHSTQRSRLSNPTQKAELRGMQYPYGCPTPPICSDTEEEEEHIMEKLAFTATTTSTTTTTQASCPPTPKCKKKEEEKQNPCMNTCPVPAPMCPCYMYPVMPLQAPSMQPQWPALEPQIKHLSGQTLPILYPTTNPPSTTIPEYHYVYIGLPKNSMRELVGQI